MVLPINSTRTRYVIRILIDVDEVRRQTVMLETGGVFAGFLVPLKTIHVKGHRELQHELPRTTPARLVVQFAQEWSSALRARLHQQLRKQRPNGDALPFPRNRYPTS